MIIRNDASCQIFFAFLASWETVDRSFLNLILQADFWPNLFLTGRKADLYKITPKK